VPAVCANFLASRIRWLLLIGWITATLASILGLFASYQFDLPTGAAFVCALGAELILVAIAAWLLGKTRDEGLA
jgi:zinc/manganese transport system permease protein